MFKTILIILYAMQVYSFDIYTLNLNVVCNPFMIYFYATEYFQ